MRPCFASHLNCSIRIADCLHHSCIPSSHQMKSCQSLFHFDHTSQCPSMYDIFICFLITLVFISNSIALFRGKTLILCLTHFLLMISFIIPEDLTILAKSVKKVCYYYCSILNIGVNLYSFNLEGLLCSLDNYLHQGSLVKI